MKSPGARVDEQTSSEWFRISSHGDAPLVAVVLHAGAEVRDEIQPRLAITSLERLREEDPHTDLWARVAPHRVVVHRSRFEIDLNRPRESAIYRTPAESWGLRVWKQPLTPGQVLRSLREYDEFYEAMDRLCREMTRRWKRFVIFDLHSYNHRRGGPTAELDPETDNPQVNVGTGSLDRPRWERVVDRFQESLRSHELRGRRLDVRENVRFHGGHFSRWVHEHFPESACVLALEFKKFFMDEWTGEPDLEIIQTIQEGLEIAAAAVLRALEEMRHQLEA